MFRSSIGSFLTHVNAQVLEVTPSFPTINDEVTIVFNAQEGNGELAGVSPVYAHMGVITDQSTSPTDWQFVQGNWGTVDSNVLMTDLGNDLHQIVVDIDQFYGFPSGTEVLQLAFVFRNAEGSLVGRAGDGSDIFYTVYSTSSGLQANILSPEGNQIVNVGDLLAVEGESSAAADLSILVDGSSVASANNATELSHSISISGTGTHELVFLAESGGDSDSDTIYYTINGTVVTAEPPAGMKDGINYLSSSSMLLQLYAPEKDFVYVIGDFNDWTADEDYFMNRSSDGATWWLQIDGLTPNEKVAYQYWVDGEIKIADPCSPLILDPGNDASISALSYPDPHPYPAQLTSGFCTVAHPGAPDFQWQATDYVRPASKDLRIYELLMRDFLETASYVTLLDTLDYLENLGVNAIEFMPPGEFENNNSWGYNPSFHMALDKYYGTPEMFKQVVDACHERGMAVIVDIVFNHAYGQSPLAHLYWDGSAPAANSPWFNTECPHPPFCWGLDFDHESAATQRFMDRVNQFWISEYNIDGFRFDYTKGFTNNDGGDFDTGRIALIQRMADVIWEEDDSAYVILEHWASNAEEEQLSDYGMMLWANVTFNYQEAAMGYIPGSNFEWGIYSQRGWSDPNLVTYMESHDEERVTYKIFQFGNSAGDYDTQEVLVAMRRNELNTVFFLSQPGPKMIWQFGELGYDISIDYDCRVCPKPILWYYQDQAWRGRLYDVYSAMNGLREDYPNTFNSTDINHSLGGAFKRINLYNSDMDAVVIGNFGVEPVSGVPNFPYTGTWYDYFSGESIVEDNLSNAFLLEPGEYRIYTSVELEQPEVAVSLNEYLATEMGVELWPSIVSETVNMSFDMGNESANLEILLIDNQGRMVKELLSQSSMRGEQNLSFNLSDIASGQYHVLIQADNQFSSAVLTKE